MITVPSTSLLSFLLECGSIVSVDSIYCQPTYLGLLEGSPNPDMNDWLMENARSKMLQVWGNRPVHIIPPAIDHTDASHPVLPPLRLTAWLTSLEPLDPENAGSELVVVWFRTECLDVPLAQVIYDGIRHLPWRSLARDFEAF